MGKAQQLLYHRAKYDINLRTYLFIYLFVHLFVCLFVLRSVVEIKVEEVTYTDVRAHGHLHVASCKTLLRMHALRMAPCSRQKHIYLKKCPQRC